MSDRASRPYKGSPEDPLDKAISVIRSEVVPMSVIHSTLDAVVHADAGGQRSKVPSSGRSSFSIGRQVDAFVDAEAKQSGSFNSLLPPFAVATGALLRCARVVFGSPRRLLPIAAIASLIVGVLTTVYWRSPDGRQTIVTMPFGRGAVISQFLATLTGTADCEWQGGVMPTYEGARLPAGTLRLVRGIAEIEFDNGARVLLEGPAEFELTSPRGGFLHRGRLVARVSPATEGFVVQSYSIKVVDLGTEFGVDVLSSGAADICCFEGLIELQTVHRPNGKVPEKLRLMSGEACHVKASGAIEVIDGQSRSLPFVRKLPAQDFSTSGGQVVNIDFNAPERESGSTGGSLPHSPTYRGMGAYRVSGDMHRATLWNGVAPMDGTSEPLLTSDGLQTSVTVELSGCNVHYTSFSRLDHALLEDYAFAHKSAGRFVLRGLWPGEKYDLYLFGTGGMSYAEQSKVGIGAAEGSLFSVLGQTKSTRGLRRGDHSLTQGKDYVVFQGVQASDEGEIRGTWTHNPQANAPENSNIYGPFNGLQLVGRPIVRDGRKL